VADMIKICYCGFTIKRPLHDPDYCSAFCKSYAVTHDTWHLVRNGHEEDLKCDWCGDNFKVVYGDRHDKVFCKKSCSFEAQSKNNWLYFNYCRLLSRHPEGLVARAIARFLDEYAFQQAPKTVSAKMKKLVTQGIVIKEDTLYRLNHPDACGLVWLSCL
tara:strand:+ start:63 stop:539 length:477 start_codon:yes stop_codon:yes gene_type:complete